MSIQSTTTKTTTTITRVHGSQGSDETIPEDDWIQNMSKLKLEENSGTDEISSTASSESVMEECIVVPVPRRDPLEEDYDLPTLKTVARWIRDGHVQNIMIVSGAGVSVSAGIPDFRSPGTGLYDNLQRYQLPYPEAVFDVSYYKRNPSPFVSLAAELWPGLKHSPTITHAFIALLEQKGILLRNYTQNIDGLEILAGVSEDKLVECHGHFRTASCINCSSPYDGEMCRHWIVNEKTAPKCPMGRCKGLIKPDIVFFGESLPTRFGKLLSKDLKRTDLLLVMGTSLMVTPVSLIPEMVDAKCYRALLNKEVVGDFEIPLSSSHWNQRDVIELGDCDSSVVQLCTLLGWKEELLALHQSRQLCPNNTVEKTKEEAVPRIK
jgi:NAD-dependent SIR2 family protein deacetylase